jgi:site-specific recombinase
MALFRSRWGRQTDVARFKQAYQVFRQNNDVREFVLPDLAEFCHAIEPAPPISDLFVQGRAAGRRDVWLRLQENINLTEPELYALWQARSISGAQ